MKNKMKVIKIKNEYEIKFVNVNVGESAKSDSK
jgi:hypothetical protein